MTLTTPKFESAVRNRKSIAQQCDPLTTQTLRRQLRIDTMIRWMLITTATFCFLLSTTMNSNNFAWPTVLAIAVIGVWFWVGTKSSLVARQIPQITSLIKQEPDTVESQLTQALGQRSLSRSLRLTLYHRLAMLRQHQQRFEEVAVICQIVLQEIPRGSSYRYNIPTEGSRVAMEQSAPVGYEQLKLHFLFMLVDASLRCNMLTNAYLALKQLHTHRLDLTDLLQLVVLQSQYEIAAGHETITLEKIDQKIALAELLPAAQNGLFHALLAKAAQRTNQTTLYQWLKRRAELLGANDSVSLEQLA